MKEKVYFRHKNTPPKKTPSKIVRSDFTNYTQFVILQQAIMQSFENKLL